MLDAMLFGTIIYSRNVLNAWKIWGKGHFGPASYSR